ncbi:MAG: hypothetical protein GC192_08920 [Bacteroidetes bacterium]|nr:hypothetical protein [Bacteroidota bacterium]
MQPSIYRNPSIDFFGLRVDEPITMLTDLLVTVVCWFAFRQLGKMRHPLPVGKGSIHRLLRGYFLTMGMATLLGGLIGHSFNYALGIHWKIPGWYISMFSVAFLERASIFHTFPLIRPRLAQFFAVLNIVELLFFLIISVATMNFYFVMGHAAYGILIVTGGFQGFVFFKTRHEGSKQFLRGVITATIGALFFVNEWAIGVWFNHMDIAHVTMALGCWFFYLGGKKIVEKPLESATESTELTPQS